MSKSSDLCECEHPEYLHTLGCSIIDCKCKVFRRKTKLSQKIICISCDKIGNLLHPNNYYIVGDTIYCMYCKQGYKLIKVIKKNE